MFILLLQVALVHLSPRILPGFLFYGKDLAAEMLKSGWAVTYAQVFLPINNNYARFF
jgi:endonuclease YncB( thermonuclease family)